MSDIVWSVFRGHWQTVQKWLNWPQAIWGGGLRNSCGPNKPCIRRESRSTTQKGGHLRDSNAHFAKLMWKLVNFPTKLQLQTIWYARTMDKAASDTPQQWIKLPRTAADLWLVKYRSDGVRHVDDTTCVTLNDKQKPISRLQQTDTWTQAINSRTWHKK